MSLREKRRKKKRKARRAARNSKSPGSVQVSKSGESDREKTAKPPEPEGEAEGSRGEPSAVDATAAGKVPAAEHSLLEWRARRRRVWFDLGIGMLIASGLVFLKLLFGDSGIVSGFRLMTYDLMQSRLRTTINVKNLPVAVVDISELDTVQSNIPGLQATPREPLVRLLRTIAAQRPSAIGIDIDFSAEEGGLVFQKDPEFFKFCLGLSGPRNAHVPVFLGVHRSDALPPEQWLDSEEFENLAASITVPGDSRKMVEAISVGGLGRDLRSMGAALAGIYRGNNAVPSLPRWMFRRVSEGSLNPATFHAPEFFVDFGPLEGLEEQTVFLLNADKEPVTLSVKRPLTGKMVLIGNATRQTALDQFNVPARSEPKPGVYLHACAAYTLALKPLFQLTYVGSVLLDILLAGLAFLVVALIRIYYYKRTTLEVATHRLELVLLIALAGISLVVGISFVNLTRVMWEDSVLVATALLVHPSVAPSIGWIRRVFRAAWRAGVLEPTARRTGNENQ
jgi:CHASE2 domain-containing sensor protein